MKANNTVLKGLLSCGILASLLYIATDLITAMVFYPGYNYTSQQVSELSAFGAPTRLFWIVMSSIWTPLVIAFGVGVWIVAGRKHTMRLTGILLIVWGIIGFVWMFFPMHPPGTVGIKADVMHIALAAVQVLVMILFISLGAAAQRQAFRLYSIGTIVAILIFGALISTKASAIAEGQTTPWMGIIERISVYLPLLWVIMVAIILLRTQTKHDINLN